MFVTTPVRISGTYWVAPPCLATPPDGPAPPISAEEKGPARSSRGGGTNGGVFCFNTRCWPLSAGRLALARNMPLRGGELHFELAGGAVLAFDNDEDERDREGKPDPAANDDSSSERSPPSRPRGRTAAPGVGNALDRKSTRLNS